MSQVTKKFNLEEHLQPSRQKKQEASTNWRVLIVEDEPSIADGIKNILKPSANIITIARSSRQKLTENIAPVNVSDSAGVNDKFELTWAKNPAEALDLVKKSIVQNKPYALGFFDVLLGADIDGIELVRQIHLIDPKIYAVFVTAYHDRTVDSINLLLGTDKSDRWDYMNKPFTDGAILQKARNAISTWNLREQKEKQDYQLADAANLLLEGQRVNSVAAVGRSIAHEFGNVLMQIIGNAEIALMKNDISSMHNSLKTILKAGETATAVLSKFKKIQNGDSRIELQNVNLNDCLNEAVDLMSHEFKKHNIQVIRIKNDEVQLDANYHSLVQVFINVLINACHAMPNSGQIDLSIINNSNKTDEDYGAKILIRDHGPGIPEHELPKVMNPFYTTKGNKGTGLGLPICREIIEMEHKGHFEITNHPSKGIQVNILLPFKQEADNE
jgi:signal transduction histidine kinase